MNFVSDLPVMMGCGPALSLEGCPVQLRERNRVNILALGDVGATMLIGLRLMGSDVIREIGICDIREENCRRLEMEINQIGYPFDGPVLPPVHVIGEESLFDCDVMIFCASRGVPPVDDGAPGNISGAPGGASGAPDGSGGTGDAPAKPVDVRMVQLEANRDIIRHYAGLAREGRYRGLVCVVSDPVDNLAAAFLEESGLAPGQVQGYGLGVMHQRARYYARKRPEKFGSYLKDGRAYGPHGQDLVIANSVEAYDDALSRELTALTVNANLEVRELGFKPYIAPALSSAAISILLTLRGEWHYSSVFLGGWAGGAFLGIRNRMTAAGVEYEDLPLPDSLYERIREAFSHLCISFGGEK